MGDIFFTTNPAEFSRLEGLYVSERKPPGFIRGQDLSTVGMAGRCVRGPDAEQIITNSGRFVDIFGARDQGSGGALLGEIWKALLNKPFGTVVVKRVRASDSVKATRNLTAAGPVTIARADASSHGAWGNNVTVAIETATDANANHWNARISYLGKVFLAENLDTTAGNDNLAAVIGSDVARFVDLVKVADGRPANAAAAALATGADGTLAVADYTAGVTSMSKFPGVAIVLSPDTVPTPATYHSTLVTLAPKVSDRIFLTWAQAHGQDVATEVAQVGTQITTRSDRIGWAYNSLFTIDPQISAEIQTAPHVWLASIMSQTDIDIHAGSFDAIAFLAGATRATNTTLERDDLIALKNAGISTVERLDDGFQFHSVVTTSLTPGLTEMTRRRMTDFLQLSASKRLRSYVKGKNTATIRILMATELVAFSTGLKDKERVVEDFEVQSEAVNTPGQRAQGEEHLLWRVRLVGHMLSVVLETEIATGTVIERAA